MHIRISGGAWDYAGHRKNFHIQGSRPNKLRKERDVEGPCMRHLSLKALPHVEQTT